MFLGNRINKAAGGLEVRDEGNDSSEPGPPAHLLNGETERLDSGKSKY